MAKNKKIRKTFSLDKSLVAEAECYCTKNQRTLSNFVNLLIEQFLKKQAKK